MLYLLDTSLELDLCSCVLNNRYYAAVSKLATRLGSRIDTVTADQDICLTIVGFSFQDDRDAHIYIQGMGSNPEDAACNFMVCTLDAISKTLLSFLKRREDLYTEGQSNQPMGFAIEKQQDDGRSTVHVSYFNFVTRLGKPLLPARPEVAVYSLIATPSVPGMGS
jgi:hypothetical protein